MKGGRGLRRLVVGAGNVYRRMLAFVAHVAGPRVTYAYYSTLAGWMYRLLDPLRARCEAQCRAALGERLSEAEIVQIARASFIHRALNLADLLLAERRMRASTFAQRGGQIPEPFRGQLLDAQAQRKPVILVTAYYGPFDLLPLLLGYNGIPAAIVYKPHRNTAFDAYRLRLRTRSGCEAVPVDRAVNRLPEVLAEGGAVAILSDHHVQRGVAASFMGMPTVVSRAVGLLAVQHDAVVAVAAIRRTGKPFSFEIVVEDLFESEVWRDAGDPVVEVTERYVGALERIVRADPAQYLWAHSRWGAAPSRNSEPPG